MKKLIKSPAILITLMCLLIIVTPYIQQTISNAIKLVIEIIIIYILLSNYQIYKKSKCLKLCYPLLLFLMLAFFSTFLYSGFTTKLLNVLVTIGAYILFYVIVHVLSDNYSKDVVLKVLSNNILAYAFVMDVIVIFTLGKGFGNYPERVFLIGNKFMLSYLHMFLLALISYRKLYSINIIKYFLYSFIILLLADTTTGLIGLFVVFLIILFLKKYRKMIDILTDPKVLILFFVLTNTIFLLSNGLTNIGFIREFFLIRSHTSSVLSGRLVMYDICKNAILKRPFFGYGINYDIVRLTLGFGNPQNGFLKLLLDYGIV